MARILPRLGLSRSCSGEGGPPGSPSSVVWAAMFVCTAADRQPRLEPSPKEGFFAHSEGLGCDASPVLLGDGQLATEWLLARYRDRLSEQETDLIRAYYMLDGVLTTRQISQKHHITEPAIVRLKHVAMERLWRLIGWEFDESRKGQALAQLTEAADEIAGLTGDHVDLIVGDHCRR